MPNPNMFEYMGHYLWPTEDGYLVLSPEGKRWHCLSLNEARKTIAFREAGELAPVGAD